MGEEREGMRLMIYDISLLFRDAGRRALRKGFELVICRFESIKY